MFAEISPAPYGEIKTNCNQNNDMGDSVDTASAAESQGFLAVVSNSQRPPLGVKQQHNHEASMTDIPATAIAFQQWIGERAPAWPEELYRLALFAGMSLDYLDQPPENRSRSLDEKARKDLIAFAVAYGEWKANNGKSR